ncbi:hypothetical protein GRF29_19g1756891 [Pseudopithomyces chartarum]|uniref:Uncharacterized protein n=1 Tax=Pseudopithomyces chartarum TaxID=1892770 RepID=A0AAN6RJP8_9PLEO|nr:hypothetical protein GRF29_19g1756891 [Pseudopithomyces chartarum]
MVSFKHILALLPLAVGAFAAPNSSPDALNALQERRCVPPSNCGSAIGSCEYCCSSGVKPNSKTCHSHGATCSNGTPKYHCDDASL